ncbi:glycosyltransferase [Siccirubricoccus sp. G192]|uniref:glycosyltransferase n=1 Tax=Siccirubricoccus sp. G192 TaxID=2849651 RepID=UPI001C2BA152|nr:glycosyltransferase [Siccirubricoccus sp. G192]MBV1796939.1 glycosyltransferase [Siccirubricoccus sp. G192]
MTDAPPGTAASMLGLADRKPLPLLLCLSHLRWDFVLQRPQHLLTRAARSHDVVFFEEPIFRPGIVPSLERHATPEGVTVVVPLLPEGLKPPAIIAAQRRLLDDLLAAEAGRPMVAWFYTPMALEFTAHLRPDLTVYDCMDELSAFRGAPPRMLELERALLGRADLVFTGGRSLYEAKRHRHPHVHCFPSSIDAAHFAVARGPQPDPQDQAGIPRPRIGFFGVVDERMDLDLLAALAAARPDWHFAMIGPVVKIEPESLPRLPNIHWLGPKKYAELPRYLAGWDLGFMPFARNESTRFISPTKTPEFLAAGLPIVSTPITDVVRDWGEAGLVEIAADAEGFAQALAALLDRPRAAWLRRVDRRLAENSWDRTWAAMAALMQEGQRSATRRPAAGLPLSAPVARAGDAQHV